MLLGWLDVLHSRVTVLIWRLHLCAINHLSYSFWKYSFFFFFWPRFYATLGIYQKHLKVFLLSFLENQRRELLHPDGSLKNHGITKKFRLEGTFGGHQVTAGLTVKLGQAFQAFLTPDSLYGSMGISLPIENSVVTTEGTHKKPKWTPQCKWGKSQTLH